MAKKGERVLFVRLGINASDGEILHQMRIMEPARGTPFFWEHVVCAIVGYEDDARELYEIPEARAFCRRLVDMGFIAFLDETTLFSSDMPAMAKQGFGAMEVWLCAEDRLQAINLMTRELADEWAKVLAQAKMRADELIGSRG
jgi:hypothetical protein